MIYGIIGGVFFTLAALNFFMGSFIEPGFSKKKFDIIVIIKFNLIESDLICKWKKYRSW